MVLLLLALPLLVLLPVSSPLRVLQLPVVLLLLVLLLDPPPLLAPKVLSLLPELLVLLLLVALLTEALHAQLAGVCLPLPVCQSVYRWHQLSYTLLPGCS